jgi:calcineurin-like phosphoesterase
MVQILDEKIDLNPSAIIVDYHAEFTSEKKALGYYLDGRVSALFGTHTHVPTADQRILPKKTAYLTDAGMVGPLNSVLWLKKELAIRYQKYPYPTRFEVETDGSMVFNSVLVQVGPDGKAERIERIDKVINE